MNECEDPDNPCQVGGTCVNIVGAFRCLCNTGFVSDVDNRQCIGKLLFFATFICCCFLFINLIILLFFTCKFVNFLYLEQF